MPADLIEITWYRAQGLVEGEGHVPGLTGEDGKDRRQLRAKLAAGKQPPIEEYRAPGQSAVGPCGFGGQCSNGKCEQERCDDRGKHPHGGAQCVFGKIPRR